MPQCNDKALMSGVMDDDELDKSSPYALKPDYWSSHSVILRLIIAKPGSLILDVGAAQGYLARLLTERGFRVTAIEGNPILAEQARPHCESLIVADLDEPLRLPENHKFDFIIFGDVLEHLRDPSSVLRAFAAYLAPGGKVIISVPNIAHLWIRLQLLAGRFNYTDRGILDRTHLRFFTLSSFRAFLEQSGFVIDIIKATPVPLPLVVPSALHGSAFNAVHAMSAHVADLWKRLFGYQFVAVVSPRRVG